ncbi:Uu.00g139800.m01.CDS01 [Anthostomella pinea]|uniref:RNA-directed DNA polymerase n=1 Tax=Anthostomella pinea TaxID=933095 RepID=A0AAI8VQS2_9PEZI|nr:Uu.00g139800.m01.CDS01 [Anthostomella pinea]
MYKQGNIEKETAALSLDIQGHAEELMLDIADISGHEIILGIPWLRVSNPRVNWRTGHLKWDTPERDLTFAQRSEKKPASKTKRTLRIFMVTKESKPIHEAREGQHPRFFPIYGLNNTQQKELQKYIDKNLARGYIRPSTSPAGYPILFVPKKNRKLRLYVDYQQLNSITTKNQYPLPLIQELRDRLQKARWFTALDLPDAYNLIRIAQGEEWKTAFRTCYGHYKYLVMPFGLTNAPASFQTMITYVLREFIDKFVIAAKLLVNTEKSDFHTQRVDFLGFTITPGEVRIQESKISAVRDWPVPNSVVDVRAFIGFTNYVRPLIINFGKHTGPLTDLTKNDRKFKWTAKEQQAFDTIRELILSDPVTRLPDPEKEFEVETDVSDYALGGQLGQRDENGKLHPVAFFSKKLYGPELNYQIHDKELIAVIEAFKEWKPYLSGTKKPVKVYSDHKNLTHFITTKELNKQQTQWAEFLSEFNFQIIYVKGQKIQGQTSLADETDEHGNLTINATQRIETQDKWTITLKNATTTNGKIEILEQHKKEFVRQFHEHLTHGHQGIFKTKERLKRRYEFPGLTKTVKEVIKEYNICNKAKAARHKPYGLLKPTEIPDRAWKRIAFDFIVKLPKSKEPMTNTEYDSIWVITDRLTKYGYFIPYKESSTAEELAYTLIRVVISKHGLPDDFVSDRDKLFMSKFWTSLTKQLGLKHRLSTAYHPQTDGRVQSDKPTQASCEMQSNSYGTMLHASSRSAAGAFYFYLPGK